MEPEVQVTPPIQRSTAKIAAALAKAQAEIEPPARNKTVKVRTNNGQEYTFDYADYAAIVAAIRGPLTKNEIAWTHLIEGTKTGFVLVTKLIHSSGEELEAIYPLPASINPKDFGGAMTYGKRYCLSGLTGCAADDDLDADPQNTTSFNDRKPAKTQTMDPKTKQAATGRLEKKEAQAENMNEINSVMDLIKARMAIITEGSTVDQKGKALVELLGVTKFDDLKNKSLEELKSKNVNLGQVVEEKKSRKTHTFRLEG